MAFRHGIYSNELPTSILPPAQINAGLIVAFGTAPINQLDNPEEAVNTPILAYTYSEAVKKLGYSTNFDDYTLSEVIKVCFALYGIAPVVFINVLDPNKHKLEIPTEELVLDAGTGKLNKSGVIHKTVVVKSSEEADAVTYKRDIDYTLAFEDDGASIINRIPTGAIKEANAALKLSYTALDPTAVTSDDVIGGVDVNTLKLTGLELLEEVYPRFKLIPAQVIAPKFSSDAEVGMLMTSKAALIGEMFKAEAITDIPSDSVTSYDKVPDWKSKNNWVAANQTVCWPKVKLDNVIYHHSTHLAAATCLSDSKNDDIPSRSPSNISLQMTSAVLADGTEVWLTKPTANYLNGNGVVTSLNYDGWKAWGNRTAIYPGSTDAKDAFRSGRRMFNWVNNMLMTTYWAKIDNVMNPRLIDSVVSSANIWFNGLSSAQRIAGGAVSFVQEDNPLTDLMNGNAKFHVQFAPYSPAEVIDFIMEYNPTYLQSLFGSSN